MPVVSENMNLIKWSALSDRFDYQELADNFSKIDAHDHRPLDQGGSGGTPIPAGGLGLSSVATANIQAEAVNESRLADNAVTSSKLQSSSDDDESRAVSTDHIKSGAITSEKLNLSLTSDIDAAIAAGVAQLESLSGFVEPWSDVTTSRSLIDLNYTFSNNTSVTYPGSGKLKFNQTEISSVTKILISSEPSDLIPSDIGSQLTQMTGRRTIEVTGTEGSVAKFNITGDEVGEAGPLSGFRILNVEFLSVDGAFANDEELLVDIYEYGLSGGWFGEARYYKDALDRVHLEIGRPGEPAAGPWNATMFILPEGYRPEESVWVMSYPGMIRVYPDGRVRPLNNLIGFEPKAGQQSQGTPLLIATGSFRTAPSDRVLSIDFDPEDPVEEEE